MNCDEILINKTALLDGEKSDVPAARIEAHLAACENCRREIALLENTVALLERQERRAVQTTDLWTAIERRIGAKTERSLTVGWQPFVLIGALLVAYKLAELLPERDLGWALKFVPFILIVLLFAFLKENPFRINTELIPEK